jgi:protein gp37
MSKMFSFITHPWNPLGGECQHNCTYCWAKSLAKRYRHQKYLGTPRIAPHELDSKFFSDDFIFVCDMTDLFGSCVPSDLILAILSSISKSPAKFLLLTKNPRRYLEFVIPPNCICGATIETNLDTGNISDAPSTIERLEAMTYWGTPHKMLSIEPILEFELEKFSTWILKMKPDFVAVGYDNYHSGLLEPSLNKTLKLIKILETAGIKVYKKTLRDPYEFTVA